MSNIFYTEPPRTDEKQRARSAVEDGVDLPEVCLELIKCDLDGLKADYGLTIYDIEWTSVGITDLVGCCRVKVKETQFAKVKARRKEIQEGLASCNCPSGSQNILMIDENRSVIDNGARIVDKYGADVATQFPILKIKTGDAEWMQLPYGDVPSIDKQVAFITEALFQTEELVQGVLEPSAPGSIEYDFDSDMTLQDFEAKDYVTIYDTAMKVAKYQDTSLYAQPAEYQ